MNKVTEHKGAPIESGTSNCCSVPELCLILCNPMDCSMPGFLVLHSLQGFAQTHVHCVNDAIQPSHPLSPASPPALNISQHQGLFQWLGSSHQVAKVSELQLQHQSFQWIFRVYSFRIDWFDFLAVHGTLKSSTAPKFESINSSALSLLNWNIAFIITGLLVPPYANCARWLMW